MGGLENALGHQSVSEMIVMPSGIANPFLASTSSIYWFHSVKFLKVIRNLSNR